MLTINLFVEKKIRDSLKSIFFAGYHMYTVYEYDMPRQATEIIEFRIDGGWNLIRIYLHTVHMFHDIHRFTLFIPHLRSKYTIFH